MQLAVGRIAKAHGVHGEVAVEVRTDEADRRFAVGAQLDTDPADAGPLTVEACRWHAGRLLVRFTGLADRDAAARLCGTLLVVDSQSSPPAEDPDEFWDHDLVGLAAVAVDGALIGTVTDVLHLPGHPVLVVQRVDDAGEMLVPFVAAVVPAVELANGRVVLSPPEGLLEL